MIRICEAEGVEILKVGNKIVDALGVEELRILLVTARGRIES